jgi:hypothetical protein
MRDLPFALTASTSFRFTIFKGASVLRFTSNETDVTVDGVTWPAKAGANISNMQFPSDGTCSTADIFIMTKAGGLVEPGDGTRGLLDGWPVIVEEFDKNNPALAYNWMPGATIGSVAEDTNGLATIAVNGQLSRANAPMTDHYSLGDRADLGDDKNKIPVLGNRTISFFDIGRGQAFVRPDIVTGLLRVADAYGRVRTGMAGTPADYANVYFECTTAGITDPTTAPTYDPTVGNSTTDGTAVFIARNTWLRHTTGQATGTFEITLDSLPDSRASDATWFVLGGLYIRSGPLNGFEQIPIRAWDPGTLKLTLFLPVLETDIPAGTQMEIAVGYDGTAEMLFSRFGDIINGRMENFVTPPLSVG